MNRVGLKDYLLNHADDNDLLDCAKAWDAANEYGQFDTYSSVEEAAQANGWDAAQALSEARRVDQDADFFRFNGYGHLETKQRIEFDAEQGDDFGEVSKYLGELFNSGSVNQSEKINDSWGNSILVKGGTVAMMVRAAESPSTRTSRKRSIHRLAGTVGTTSSPIVKSTKSGMKTDLCS